MIGNFIADHLKGKMREQYQGDILRGIKLHHAIDAFTDRHHVVEQSKLRIRPVMNKYTPVVVDVYYDHFLGKNWSRFHHHNLDQFARDVYTMLDSRRDILPERTQIMLGYMQKQNWLAGYSQLNQLQQIFSNMSVRSKYENNMQQAVTLLSSDYHLFESEFLIFFEDLRNMCREFLLND